MWKNIPHRVIVAVIVGGALALAISRTSGQHLTANRDLPVLRWNGLAGTATWPGTLDPPMSNDTISAGVIAMVNASLTKFLPDGTVVPDLSTWTVSHNHRVYTFTLRPNLRFTNGDPVTAGDVGFSLTRDLAKSTNSPSALSYMAHIIGAKRLNDGKTTRLQGVRVLNSRQVRISLDRPVAFFLGQLAGQFSSVLDKRILSGKPAGTYLTRTCSANVGTGPFMFACRSQHTGLDSFYPAGTTATMTLVPNPHYYGHKPRIKIVMRAIATTQVNYEVFQANGVDATSLPTGDIGRERGKPGFFQIPSLLDYYITPNMVDRPFNNVHCARAIAYSINQDAINRQILHGSAFTIHSAVPKGLAGYFNSPAIPHYDPARARAEYRLCPGGIHGVQLIYSHSSTDLDNVYGSAIPAMWNAVGIHIAPKPVTFNDWIGVVSQPMSKSHTLLTENNDGGLPDPWNFATVNLHVGGIYNIGQYNNPTVNKLFDRADVAAKSRQRASLYIRGETVALNQGAMIPISQAYGFAMVKPWVHGFVGSVAFGLLVPRGNDWSNVTVSAH